MAEPLACFLTWTCYGTWLHGDNRGSVDLLHNTPGTPLLDADPDRTQGVRRTLRDPAYFLSDAARAVVRKVIEDHCQFRGWTLLAANARTNHVHVVVQAPSISPEIVLNQFKAWATRRLREAGLVDECVTIWTRHGSTRYLDTMSSVEAAVRYVDEEQ